MLAILMIFYVPMSSDGTQASAVRCPRCHVKYLATNHLQGAIFEHLRTRSSIRYLKMNQGSPIH